MTAIWQNDGSGWHLLTPTGFPNEAKLHDLIEQAHLYLPGGLAVSSHFVSLDALMVKVNRYSAPDDRPSLIRSILDVQDV